jgi:hypothetical protein
LLSFFYHLLQFNGIQPVMQGLLSKLQQVNATVIALTADMEGAYSKLGAANDNMVSPHCSYLVNS